MRLKHVSCLVIAAASAIALASPAASAQRLSTAAGKERCKEEKARFHRQERTLKDRQRLARDQCKASASRGGTNRCKELKHQQKAQLKQLKDRHKLALKACKEDIKDSKLKDDKKADKHKAKPDHPDQRD